MAEVQLALTTTNGPIKTQLEQYIQTNWTLKTPQEKAVAFPRARRPLRKPDCCGRLGPASEAQHQLGHDVALDLVGAGVDRGLAVVEVAAR